MKLSFIELSGDEGGLPRGSSPGRSGSWGEDTDAWGVLARILAAGDKPEFSVCRKKKKIKAELFFVNVYILSDLMIIYSDLERK